MQSAIINKLFLLLLGLLFVLSYTQAPLYDSNQHAHLLRGLAAGGYGDLQTDWLAHTADPFPMFSLVISNTYRYLHENFFYLYQGIVLLVYFFVFIAIADKLFGLRRNKVMFLLFVALVVFLHSDLASQLFTATMSQDIGRVLHQGVAMQYAVNHYFQPSSFTVFLLLAVYLFLVRRDNWAAATVGLTCVFYFSIAVGGAILILAFCYVLWFRERKHGQAIAIAILAFVIVLPVVIYVLFTFSASDPSAHEAMQSYFVNVRFPHHANPQDWGKDSFGKLAFVGLAIFLVRKSRIFWIMLISTVAVVALTGLTMLTSSKTMALLFPWRLSTVLVPIAFSVCLAALISFLHQRDIFKPGRITLIITLALLITSTGWGIYQQLHLFNQKNESEEAKLFEYARRNHQTRDRYLAPHGLEGFRLATGVPIYVSYKSHPYKDVEVAKWLRRIEDSRQIYDEWQTLDENWLITFMRVHRLSHVVLYRERFQPTSNAFREVYSDDTYDVFELRR